LEEQIAGAKAKLVECPPKDEEMWSIRADYLQKCVAKLAQAIAEHAEKAVPSNFTECGVDSDSNSGDGSLGETGGSPGSHDGSLESPPVVGACLAAHSCLMSAANNMCLGRNLGPIAAMKHAGHPNAFTPRRFGVTARGLDGVVSFFCFVFSFSFFVYLFYIMSFFGFGVSGRRLYFCVSWVMFFWGLVFLFNSCVD
jgi:hypothetical protein